jgi:hypothetical protein
MSLSLCGQLDLNTGQISCDQRKGRPLMLIFGGATLATSDYADTATSDAYLLAKMKLARNSATKLFPLPVIQGVSDKTEAAKYGALGYGLQIKLLRSKPGYEFDMIPGTAQEKQIIKLDGQTVPVRIYDDNKIIWGSVNSAGVASGINVFVGVEPAPFADGQNPKTTKVTISFIDGEDGCENLFGLPTALLTSDLKGLNDVTLTEKSAHASNVFKILGVSKSAVANRNVNLASTFGATLASAPLWVATVVASGVAHTITSVAVNAAGDGYDVTLDTTQFAALSSGATIDINLAAPSVLDAAGVTEVEGIKVRVTK